MDIYSDFYVEIYNEKVASMQKQFLRWCGGWGNIFNKPDYVILYPKTALHRKIFPDKQLLYLLLRKTS